MKKSKDGTGLTENHHKAKTFEDVVTKIKKDMQFKTPPRRLDFIILFNFDLFVNTISLVSKWLLLISRMCKSKQCYFLHLVVLQSSEK